MKKYILSCVMALCLAISLSAQTMHVVIFCNTIDQSIGESMKTEMNNMTNQMKTILGMLDYDEDFHQLYGPDCTRANLKSVIDEMYVEPDDVILTFYGGHGSHAENNESDPWPQYLMNSGFENQGNWVPMQALANWVKAKNARLSIILSNCCNVVQGATTIKPLWAMGGDYTKLEGLNADNYKKLFAQKGFVMATSSKIPEPSWCCEALGGLFTADLCTSFDMVGKGTLQPTWDALLKKSYDLCVQRDIVDREGVHHKQHPLYKVNYGGGTEPKIVPPRVDDRRSNDKIDQALIDILNDKVSKEKRLDMIQGMLNNAFAGVSHVLTVGKDMTTIVDNETPRTFLRRICLSPYIVQVNKLSVEDGILTVHEVRK